MQKIMRLAALALPAALALSACATTRGAPLPDGSDVALGQRAYVDGPLVEPVAVIEDSRCPMNARCIWAGRVRVKMLWHRPTGENLPFEVVLGEPARLADGTITLESVRPEKRSDATIKPQNYRFSFRFAGGL
ncbi:MAG: hypothetical protein C0520_09590 [Sphingopyxis sp.]|nr:hypothetical protein [Sphingopyxis sp.]